MDTRSELGQFLQQDLDWMLSEYRRITARSAEDPGTAGDAGEENWATTIRNWLPDAYEVVTKGRVVNTYGQFTPQVDIIVLRPGYPRHLKERKVYLSTGIAAAFECKLTLRLADIRKAAATGATIRKICAPQRGSHAGSPYRVLYGAPVYGLLAHSASWKAHGSMPLRNIDRELKKILDTCEHPRDLIDILCIADLNCWESVKVIYNGPSLVPQHEWKKHCDEFGYPSDGCVMGGLGRWVADSGGTMLNPVGIAVCRLLERLAWDDPSIKPMADYFRLGVRRGRDGDTIHRWWPLSVYPEEISTLLKLGGFENGAVWSEWNVFF